MEIREIFDTIENDPKMDEALQNDILEKIANIAKADELVDGLEEKIEQHKDELSEKELKYIINKCISYKSVFYKFRNGGIVDYDQLNEITRRIFELEEGIRTNDFHIWKEELLQYKGSKQDKEEDRMLKNMLMVVPEEKNVVEKVTRMFRRALWKLQQKNNKKTASDSVIELPQNNKMIDIELHDYEESPKEDVNIQEEKEDKEELLKEESADVDNNLEENKEEKKEEQKQE